MTPGAEMDRRSLAKGAVWAAPVLSAASAAPVLANSGTTCYTGNIGGTLNSAQSISGAPRFLVDGAWWARFDILVTATNSWEYSTITALQFVAPFGFSGPIAAGSAGPFTPATWDDAAGCWRSTRPESADKAIYLSEYQSRTPLPRVDYGIYTSMPLYPPGTSYPNPTGGEPATVAPDADVFVLDILPIPLAYGQTATAQFSMWVEEASPGRMQSAYRGYYLGTVCRPK